MSLNTTSSNYLVKAPVERRYYSMDFSALLSTSEIISSITSITSEKRGVGTSDLLIDGTGISSDGKSIEMFIGSGTDFQTYRIEVQIMTSDSNILQGDGLLKVSDK